MNTLRARSTKSDGCASDRAKPSRDVSTSTKRSWKSRERVAQTVQEPSYDTTPCRCVRRDPQVALRTQDRPQAPVHS